MPLLRVVIICWCWLVAPGAPLADDSAGSVPEVAAPAATAAPAVPPAATAAPAAPPAAPLEYQVEFSGLSDSQPPVADSQLRELLEAASSALALQDTPPAGLLQLRRRAAKDQAELLAVLHSRGYYDGKVEWTVDESSAPLRLNFAITPGVLYTLERVALVVEPEGGLHLALPTPASLGLELGASARAARVLSGEEKLVEWARQQGYPFAVAGKRRVMVDPATKRMEAVLTVIPGVRARLGQAGFAGAAGVAEGYLRRRLAWQSGEWYQPELITKSRDQLLATELFSSVELVIATVPDARGDHPVTVNLTRRPPRTVSTGVGYATDVGATLTAAWEHRDYFGGGEKMVVEGEVAETNRELDLTLTLPDYLGRSQTMTVENTLQDEETSAYDQFSFSMAGTVERSWGEEWTFSYGAGLRWVSLTEAGAEDAEEFGLISLPLAAKIDRSDDELDPSRGWRFNTSTTLFYDTMGSGVLFAKSEGSATRYLQLMERPRVVAAGRAGGGVIVGVERSAAPADELFYAGGGGSVRGYAYQLASPLDDSDQPEGGLSKLEAAGELRVQPWERFGFSVFLDGGRAYSTLLPRLDQEPLLWGTGTGFQYLSPAGPVRLDLALPLTPRTGVDDAFQLYLSIGQAF